ALPIYIALAWILAGQRGVRHGIDVEMLLGMATGQAEAIKNDVGSLLLYTPVVHPTEFDVAIAYLIRRLEEGASSENFMSAVFDIDSDERLFQREKERFLTSIDMMPADVPEANRVMDRHEPQPEGPRGEVWNTPDTDPAVDANRAWAAGIRSRMQDSELGNATLEEATLSSAEALDSAIAETHAASEAWRSRPLSE